MSNRSAAGLRRSAIVARIKLREEWSELKGPQENPKKLNQIPEIIRKEQKPVRSASKVITQKIKYTKTGAPKCTKTVLKDQTNIKPKSKIPKSRDGMIMSNRNIVNASIEVLRGIVALVEVGAETRALALRAALLAMGATVLPAWSPLVTHLVWTEGGCRATRARARALGCRVVSPLWVEACAGTGRRVSEDTFPAVTRPSDLPSPRTLQVLLKRAEAENISLSHFLINGKEQDKQPRLRISSGSEADTSADKSTDKSTDRSDTSLDKSRDTTDPEIRVNTLPRGGRAARLDAPKSRRKLFTHKEAEDISSADETATPSTKRMEPKPALSRVERKDLARAERMARRMLGAPETILTQASGEPRIVLTGMSRSERQLVQAAIKTLNGRVQRQVTHRTTHVLLGSCHSHGNFDPNTTGIHPLSQTLSGSKIPSTRYNIPGATQIARCEIPKARTLNALLGSARGCRILHAQWAMDSLAVKKWLHHHGYEVNHLKKISQKARVERAALGRTCSEYAYDIFNGMRVYVTPQTEQKDAAIQLLTLCGGIVQNGGQTQNGGKIQDGGQRTADCDVCLGVGEGEISSKWVFDSVAAGRMRTTRRYVNRCVEGNT